MNGHKSRELRKFATLTYNKNIAILGLTLRQYYNKIKRQYIKGRNNENKYQSINSR